MIAAFDSGEMYEMMNAVEAQNDSSDYLTAISDELSTIIQILK